MLSLTTGGRGDSEDWRDVEGLLDNIRLQESGNCGKSGYTHTCIVGFNWKPIMSAQFPSGWNE